MTLFHQLILRNVIFGTDTSLIPYCLHQLWVAFSNSCDFERRICCSCKRIIEIWRIVNKFYGKVRTLTINQLTKVEKGSSNLKNKQTSYLQKGSVLRYYRLGISIFTQKVAASDLLSVTNLLSTLCFWNQRAMIIIKEGIWFDLSDTLLFLFFICIIIAFFWKWNNKNYSKMKITSGNLILNNLQLFVLVCQKIM